MKPIIALLLACVLTFSLIGCTSVDVPENTSNWTTDENGTNIMRNEYGTTAMPTELPYTIPYNSTSVDLKDVEMYEGQFRDYSYCAFVTVMLDVSNLNDEELHWLRKSDLKILTYLTHDKNEYDFAELEELGNLYIESSNILLFVYVTDLDKENRYSFSNCDVIVRTQINQEEKYSTVMSDGKELNGHKSEIAQYIYEVGENVLDVNALPKLWLDSINEWLNKK